MQDIGGGYYYEEFRCNDCDAVKKVKTMNRSSPNYKPPTEKEIGRCEVCSGQLRNDINPLCPECGKRTVERKEILLDLDE